MNTGKVILGVLAGAAAGALLGVLFAPAKGSLTRKKIARKSHEYTDELGDKFNEFIDDITEKFEDMRDETMRKMHGAKSKVKEEAEDVLVGANRRVQQS